MNWARFQCVKEDVAVAPATQILELEGFIQQLAEWRFTEVVLARRTRSMMQTRSCPHCQGNDVVLHGRDRNGRQRFKCRRCTKTYNITTGTPLARARKPEKWASYLDFMTEHKSVRKIVSAGIGVNHVTVWRWRHRFLTATVSDTAAVLSGVIEADVIHFPQSRKGSRRRVARDQAEPPVGHVAPPGSRKLLMLRQQVPVLTALDNSNHVHQEVLSSTRTIEAVLLGRIESGSILCSGNAGVFGAVADGACIDHVTVTTRQSSLQHDANRGGSVTKMRLAQRGLERVNEHHRHLKNLIDGRCRGVATRYLANYLGWNRSIIRPGFEGRMLLQNALVTVQGVMPSL